VRNRIVEEARKRSATITLIEDAGSGTSLYQDLRGTITVFPCKPTGEKVVRFQPATIRILAGEVHLPARARWLDAFKRELLSFPASAHDDQVDAFSQLVKWDNERPRYTKLYSRQVYHW
jgi:predicted phage terminase large subunit-like protein